MTSKLTLRVETEKETFIYKATAEEVDANIQNTYSEPLGGPFDAIYVPLASRKIGTVLTLTMRRPTEEQLTSEKK